MHSDIDAIERMEIVRGLRLGEFDVLIGINLLREGLDLPEVSLVAILDADQEGFLRSDRSLIQTIGRAARNVSGRAIFYADRITGSMERAIEETKRRRDTQRAWNTEHGITPKTVIKSTDQVRFITRVADAREAREARDEERARRVAESSPDYMKDPSKLIAALEKQMKEAAAELDFETAARLRDELFEIRAKADGSRSRPRGAFAGIRVER
jgi:excinuclease ABC subunit B